MENTVIKVTIRFKDVENHLNFEQSFKEKLK